jgi:hypothetical protein
MSLLPFTACKTHESSDMPHTFLKVQMPVGTRNSLANNIPESRGTDRLFLRDGNQGVVSSLCYICRSELLLDFKIFTCAPYS